MLIGNSLFDASEPMPTDGPRADLYRFGAVLAATPRQSDLVIVVGALTLTKLAL